MYQLIFRRLVWLYSPLQLLKALYWAWCRFRWSNHVVSSHRSCAIYTYCRSVAQIHFLSPVLAEQPQLVIWHFRLMATHHLRLNLEDWVPPPPFQDLVQLIFLCLVEGQTVISLMCVKSLGVVPWDFHRSHSGCYFMLNDITMFSLTHTSPYSGFSYRLARSWQFISWWSKSYYRN